MDSTAIKMICSVLFGVWGLTLRLFAVKCAAESVAESECHAVAPNQRRVVYLDGGYSKRQSKQAQTQTHRDADTIDTVRQSQNWTGADSSAPDPPERSPSLSLQTANKKCVNK